MTYEMEMALQNTFLDFVNFTLTAGWIILAVLILRAVLTRVPRKYVCLLWFVVLFRLLCPVTFETALSVVPQPTTITYEEVAYTTPKVETNSTAVNTVADFTINPIMEEYLAPNPQGSVNPMQVHLFVASIVWMLGVIIIGLYTIISWVRMALRLRESVPEDGYYRCANIQSPFVFGLLKPKIYLPYGLDGEAKDYVLLHEQSHIARKDFLLKPLFWLAVMIHWMNPMVWIGWHYFSRDLELACDERAVDALDHNQKSDYSQTLLNLAVQPKRFTCPVAFGNNSVKQRIQHVLSYKGIPALARDIIVILLILVMALLAVNPLKEETVTEPLPYYPDTTFYTDLNHDGKEEIIIVNVNEWDETEIAYIAVYHENGKELYHHDLGRAHAGWGNYFLYEKDGKEYLLEFMPSIYQGVANYAWYLYEFNDKNELVIADENSVEFSVNAEQYNFEIPQIHAFLTEIETMLNDAMLLVSVEDFALQYSTVNEPKQLPLDYYLDWLDTTWNDEINPGTTLIERLANYQNSIYYDRPRQDLIEWLVERKGMDITQQYLAGPQLIEIDGIQCVVFDLRWNEIAPVPGGHIDRYAISTQNPVNFEAVGNSRNYYLQNLQGEWIYLENSADIVDLHGIASQWADTYASRDGQGRYDLLSNALQKKVDKLDEYEGLEEAPWLPYWLDNKETLGLGNSSPWVQAMHVRSNVVVGGEKNKYIANILYEMMDSGQGEYMYEETIVLGKENGAWKVVDCDITVNLLQTDIYALAEDITKSLQEGHESWRLDPLKVASKFADDYLQMTEGYWMEFDESRNVVLCHTDTRDYTIYLYQPIHRGDFTDFYAVSGYAYYETDEQGKEVLRHYHVGNDPWASLYIKVAE